MFINWKSMMVFICPSLVSTTSQYECLWPCNNFLEIQNQIKCLVNNSRVQYFSRFYNFESPSAFSVAKATLEVQMSVRSSVRLSVSHQNPQIA